MRLILLFVLFTAGVFGKAQNPIAFDNHVASRNVTVYKHQNFIYNNVVNNESCTPTLSTGAIIGSPICAGTIISVPYTFTDCVDAGNIFTVELSDAAGNFSSPTIIGSLSSTSSGSISAIIPPFIATVGSAYRIRVVASAPSTIGTDNGTDLTIIPKPNAGFTVNANAQCVTNNSFIFTNTSTGSISGFNWSLGDGKTFTTNNAIDTYLVAGNYNVKLVATGSNGCKDSVTQTISVNSKPVANFSITNSTLCQGENFSFTNSSSIAFGSISYSWNFGDNTTAFSINANHIYNAGGSFDVKLIALSNGGCIDSITKTVNVLPKETALFTTNSLTQCGTNNFVFTNNTSGVTTSFWSFGDGITSTLTSPAKSYATAGTYAVKLVVTNFNGCKDSTTKTVTVLSKPTAAFAIAGSTNCSNNSTFTFNNTSTGTGNTYLWNFGDGDTSSAINPSHTYSLEGTYTVQLLVIGSNGCRDSISKVITFSSNAAASFTINNSSQCTGTNNFVFTNTSNGNVINSNWSFGDGINSTVTSPAKSYTVAGNYSVKLVVTNSNGCKDSITHNVSVSAAPTVGFTTSGVINCTNNLTIQNNNTTTNATTYLWSFGDATTSTAVSPSHTYSLAGTYIIKLIASNANGCSDSVSRTITFTPNPVAAFGITNAVQCLTGNSFVPNNTSANGLTYAWSFGDGTTSNLATPTKTYLTNGNYIIKLVVTNVNGCKDSVSNAVAVLRSPKAAFTATYLPCNSLSVQFSQTDTSATKFSVWDFGDGNVVNDVFKPLHIYSAFGTYTVKYYTYDATSTCIDSATKTITLSSNPVAVIHNSASNKQCLNGNSFSFVSNSLFATSYNWTFGDGSTSTAANPPAKTYNNAGIYTVTLTVTNNNGCTNSTTITDTVLPSPKANFNVIYQTCNRNNVRFIQIDTTNTKYSAWDFGDGNGASDVFNTVHSYASINSFNIKYYAYDTNFYCVDSATKTITFSNIPAAGIGFPYTSKQCFNGNSFTHINTSIGATNYLWDFGDGSTSTAATPPAKTFNAPGIYTVKLTVTNASGCTGSTTVLDTVLPSPKAAFTASNQICNNLNVQFAQINTSATKWSYLNFGDGKDTADVFNVSHTYATSGTYTVKYFSYDSNFYCSDSATKIVTLNPKPIAGITYLSSMNLVQCSNNNSYTFADASFNAVSYLWSFGDGSTSTAASPAAHIYSVAGNYVVKQVITGINGCKDSATVNVQVVQSPKAAFTATYNACNNLTVQFVQTDTTNTPLSTWDFGDGNSVIDVHNTTYTYSSIGTYTVTYSAFNTAPVYCEDIATKVITFSSNPTAAFTTTNATQCLNGNAFSFNNTSLNAVSYMWYFGDGSFSTQQTPSPKTYANAGTFNVKQIVTNASGCKDSVTHSVTVSQSPNAAFTASFNACNNLTVQFAQTNTGNTVFSAWNFGDGSGASDIFSTAHTYSTTGTYTIKYYAYDASFTCVDSATKTITLSPKPTADFTFSSLPQCVNSNSINFINTSSNAVSYTWTFGDGSFSFATNPVVTYTSVGTYTVKLIASNINGCKDSTTRTITILPKPIPSFNIIGNTLCSSNLSVALDNTTTGVGNTYLWSFGDGDISTAASVTKVYAAYGTYNIKLVVTSAAGCKDSITKQITFTEKPSAAFSFTSNNQCVNPAFSFTNNSANYASSQWTFGDGGSSTANSPLYTYANTGTYIVKLVVTNANGCKDSISNTISINPKPVANFNIIAANCTANKTISINSTATNATSYYYEFGDGTTSTFTAPTKTYSSIGTYTIKQVVTNANGCKDSTFLVVTLTNLPVAAFNVNDISQCLKGNNFVLTNTSFNSISSVWSFGDGALSTQSSPVHSYTNNGNYTIKLVVTNTNGCKDSTTTNISVLASPTSAFSYTGATGCTPARTINIVDNSTNAATFYYDFGDGTNSSLQNPIKIYTTAGTYIIKQIVTGANGCKDSSIQTVTFNDLSTAAFAINSNSQCMNGNSFSFTNNSSNIISSAWSFGDGATSTLNSPTHVYTSAGTFIAKLVVTNANGCKDSLSTTIEVLTNPVSAFNHTGLTGCTNNRTITIADASTNGTTYYYDFGDGTNSSLQNPVKTYAATGTYIIKQIVTSINGCKDSSTQTITFTNAPTASFSVNNNAQCLNTNGFVFTNNSTNAISNLWSFGDATTSTQTSPTHIYTSAGAFIVKLIVTNTNGCKDSISTSITTLAAPKSMFSFTGITGCTSNRTITIVDAATNGSTYYYDFGDGTNSSLQNPTKIYSTAGIYIIKQVVTNINGCKDSSSQTVAFTGIAAAAFTATPNSTCSNSNNVIITNNSVNATIYSWSFGDGTTSTFASPIKNYATSGTFTIKLVVSNAGGCKDSVTQTVTVVAKPVASFSIPNFNNCSNGNTFNFINTTTNAINYKWYFGDGNTSTLISPSHTYTATGTYNVKLVATNSNGCSDSITKSISFVTKPIAQFTTTVSTSCNNSFTFNNTSISNAASATYLWTFGDATFSFMQSPTKAYTNAGTYNVVLIVTNSNGCKDTTSQSITVAAKPVAAFNLINFSNCNNNNSITAQSTSTNVTNISWDFGDGTNATGAFVSKTYAAAGTYTITLIVSNANGCTDSTKKTITLSAKPIAAFTVNNITQCANNNSYSFTNTSSISSGTLQYIWQFGDGTTSTQLNATKVYGSAGTYTVKLIAINANTNCNDTATTTVTVLAKPFAQFNIASPLCTNSKTVAFNNTSTNISTINWNFGDGNTSLAYSPSNTYVNDGKYTVSLIVKNAGGCSDTASRIVNIAALPVASFNVNNSTQCFTGNSFSFSNTSANAANHAWSFGDGVGTTTISPTHSYLNTGTYNATLVVTNSNGCADSAKQSIVVNASPTANFSYSGATNCTNNLTLNFSNASTNATSYIWDFGDGVNSSLATPVHTYSTQGTYTITLTANHSNGCNDIVTQTVTFTSKPTAAFTVTGGSQCVTNNSYLFTNASINATNYIWSFGDGATSTLPNPTHSYATAGTFTVTLTASNENGCTTSSTGTVTVVAKPTAAFSLNNFNVCTSGNTVSLTNTSTGATSYLWDFGNGVLSNQANPTVTYSTAGTYTITLTATNSNGCSDVATQTVTTVTKPIAAFTVVGGNQCVTNNSYSFNDNSTNTSSYAWSFGDGTTSASNSPTHSYTTAGTYTVTLVVTSATGCTASSSSSVTVVAKPTAAFNFNNFNACTSGNTVTLANTSTGATNYLWDFGNGVLSNQTSPTVTYSTAGTYTITLTATNSNGCSETISKTVTTISKPTAIFTIANNATQCTGNNNFSFVNNSVNASSYAWNFGDGATSTLNSPSHTYTGSGTFTVTLTVSNSAGCSSSSIATVTILSKPTASFNLSNYNACTSNNTISPNNTSTNATSYVWDFGDNILSAQPNPVHTYTNAGTYVVTLITTNSNGCSDTTKQSIAIANKPTSLFAIGGNSNQCINTNNFTFVNYSTNAASYIWNFGDGTTATTANTTHSYTSSGTYTITLTVASASGCSATSSQTIVVNNKPDAAFTINNNNQCISGNLFTFTNTSVNLSGVSYLWNFGDSNYTTQTNAIKTYANAGIYRVVLTATNSNGCVDSVIKFVTVNSKPLAAFVYSNKQCTDTAIAFTNKTTGITASYIWRFGDGTTTINSNPSHAYTTAGTYTVTLVAINDGNCRDSASQTIFIANKPVANFTVASPNTCAGVFTFTNTSTGNIITNNWNFGDSSGDVNINPLHTFSNAGNYSIKLYVATAPGCADSITKTTTVLPKPKTSYTQTAVLNCINGNNFTFTSTSTAGTLAISNTWSFGDGTTANGNTVTKTYSTAGTFNVKLVSTIIATGCMDSVIQPVTVYPKPGGTISGSVAICKGTSAILSVAFTGTPPFSFTYNDGNVNRTISNIATTTYSFTVIPDVTTTYRLVQVKDALCTAGEADLPGNATVTISNLTYTKQPESVTTCIGKNVILSAAAFSNAAFTYQWFKNGIAIPGATDDTLTLNNVSTVDNGYYKLAAVFPCGSFTSNTVTLKVDPPPPPPLYVSDYTYCQYDVSRPLSAIGSTVKWYDNAVTGIGSAIAPTPPTNLPGTYQYWVTNTTLPTCESPRFVVTTVVLPAPTVKATVTGPTVLIPTQTTTLTATASANAVGVKWYYNGNYIGLTPNNKVVVDFTKPGSYYAEAITADGCKAKTDSIVIVANKGLPSSGNSNNLLLYPNPTRSFINMYFNNPVNENVRIRIVNSVGQLVKDIPFKYTAANQIVKLDVSALQPEMYAIEVINHLGTSIARNLFVKLN